MARIIVHIDLNAFFATCEELRDPRLAEAPLIIGSSGRNGIVSTCNYKARAYGIHSGQPTFQAIRCYPRVKIIEPDYRYYQVMSTSFFCLIKEYCKLLEIASIDECYADFTDILPRQEDPIGYLRAIQLRVKKELGLSCSMGVAPTKWLAKMGSDIKKPMGLTLIHRRDIPSIIYPLPISSFWGIGKKTWPLLQQKGISTIGDLKKALDDHRIEIEKMFGSYLDTIKGWMEGKGDDQVILEYDDPKSIGNSTSLPYDCESLEEIDEALKMLAKEVSERAKKAHLKGYGITLTVKDTSFHLHTKSIMLEKSTDAMLTLLNTSRDLYTAHYEGMMIRLVGITLTHLVDPSRENVQMTLWDYEEYQEMDQTKLLMERLNRKLGEDTLVRTREAKKGNKHGNR